MRDIAIQRIMTPEPITVGPDDSAASAGRLLESNGIHHLPVVENGVLIGMLSTSDFLKLHVLRERPRALEAIPVRRIMEPDPVTLDVSADLIDVATKLREGYFHALPVVKQGNVLVGIVTSSDLINHLLMQIPHGDGSLREHPRSEAKYHLLIEIYRAAEHYMRSGLAEHEHSELQKRLLDLHRWESDAAAREK